MKELRPPQELVDAIQASEDMTAPAEHGSTALTGADNHNTPHNIRNKLAHEQALASKSDKEAVAAALGLPSSNHVSKHEFKEHMKEVEATHGKGGTFGAGATGNRIKGSSAAGHQAVSNAASRSAGRESYNSSHTGSHLM